MGGGSREISKPLILACPGNSVARTWENRKLCRQHRFSQCADCSKQAPAVGGQNLITTKTTKATMDGQRIQKPPLEDPLHEREIFASEIAGIAMVHGNFVVTLAQSFDLKNALGVQAGKVRRIVSGRLVLTNVAANQLLQNLQSNRGGGCCRGWPQAKLSSARKRWDRFVVRSRILGNGT